MKSARLGTGFRGWSWAKVERLNDWLTHLKSVFSVLHLPQDDTSTNTTRTLTTGPIPALHGAAELQ